MRPMLEPMGRTIMISGAARGIGLATARRLHDEGYALSLGARNLNDLRAATSDWSGPEITHHRFDALDDDSQQQWVDECVAAHGRLDGLVNNAGVILPFSLTDFEADGLDGMWEVNVKTPARLASMAYPHLKSSPNGRVVNIASMSAKRVRGGFEPGYAMTKHAVMALTHATRQQWWDDGIRATAICPSWVETDMIAEVDYGEEPVIAPDDIAALVSLALALPNHASMAELAINCRREDAC